MSEVSIFWLLSVAGGTCLGLALSLDPNAGFVRGPYAFEKVNNGGADWTVQVRRLICV